MGYPSTPSLYPGTLIAGRYTVQQALGKGGMGSVYAVHDVSTGRQLALKYLRREAARENGPAAALFQREFHTLAHLKHPRVIQVHDYGVDQGRPYYTMELLDGSDLRELAPVPWQRACAVLRDIASSLALLHSRRLLHRDLSPRNVRCTRDGRAKLIDFGTMSPMGLSKDVAGTPPYMAPEAVHGQALDARTDLYALGALAYWTLTGYDAYPARDARDLRKLWLRPVLPPSALRPGIPAALDALVMSLLNLDARARPSHVAEVIERLTAIASLEQIEALEIAHAYLTSPSLIGHTEALINFHKRLVRAQRGRGSALLVRGEQGLGRSRLLQALVLEAKLCGAHVLHAEPENAARGELGLAQALLRQLAETAPDVAAATFAPHAEVLGELFPGLGPEVASPATPAAERDGHMWRARVMQAMRDWLLAASRHRLIMIAVDDLELADEHSAVLLALLAATAGGEAMVLVAVTDGGAEAQASRALHSFATAASVLDLAPLGVDDTTALLRSVFGEVPNLQVVADWTYALSRGAPRTVMELAQYLVDHRMARYERGSWTLPASLRDQALPSSVEQALGEVVAELGADARGLAEAVALVGDHGRLRLDELVQLSGLPSADQAYVAIDELIATHVIVTSGESCALRHRGLTRVLVRGLSEERRRKLHLKIAELYEATAARPDAAPETRLLAAYHSYLGGAIAVCLEHLLSAPDPSRTPFGCSADAIAMYEACLVHGEAAGLAPLRLFALRRALLQLAAAADPRLVRHADAAIAQLLHDSGRVYSADFAAEVDPVRRVRACLARARRVHDATDPSKRGLEPVEATYELASSAMLLTRAYMARYDLEGLKRVPDLIAPLASLAPSFDLLHELTLQTRDLVLGKDVQARRLRTLDQLELPLQGLDPDSQQTIRCIVSYWAGMDEAAMGKRSALDRAAALERLPLYAPLGAELRALYHLFLGNEVEAEACQKRGEVLDLQSPYRGLTTTWGIVYEVAGYHLCGSVLGMRRAIATMSELAAKHPGWERQLRRANGLYALLRGEPHVALGLLDGPESAAERVHALLALGDAQAARAAAEHAAGQAGPGRGRADFGQLQVARALSASACGEHVVAAKLLDVELEHARREGLSGMALCALHEARARVAIDMDDRVAFREHARALGAAYGRSASSLRARYEQLGLAARRALMSVPPPQPVTIAEAAESPGDDVRTQIGLMGSRERRLEYALSLLKAAAKSSAAFLFGFTDSGLRLLASVGAAAPPDGMEDMLTFYLDAELASSAPVPRTVTGTFSAAPDMIAWINDGERLYYPVLLGCVREQARVLAGVAVLGLPLQRAPALSQDLIEDVAHSLLDVGGIVPVKAAD